MTYDPHWNNVVLAMHMDGVDGSTTFTDIKGSVVTPLGGAVISEAQSKFGGASGYFNGTNAYLTVPNSESTQLLGGDFTIEAWVYPISVGSASKLFSKRQWLSSNTSGFSLHFYSSAWNFQYTVDGVNFITMSLGAAPALNTWTHVAVVRLGSTVTLFQNGVSTGSGSLVGTPVDNTADLFSIGGPLENNSYFNGYIDDVRVTKGVARYTTNFTPPTESFPLGATGVVTGFVSDNTNSSAVRLVRAYRRDTGAFVGETLSNGSGLYSISTDSTSPHFIVCHDASSTPPTGGTLNALIFDNVTPLPA